MLENVTALSYLVAASLFIVGLKMLASPRSAVLGNYLSALGMLIAVLVALLDQRIVSYWVIIAAIVSGSAVALIMAYRAPMTAMPQVVAVLNGVGGLSSVLAVGANAHEELLKPFYGLGLTFTIPAANTAVIGGVTIFGSFIAFAKLQGWMGDRPLLLPARHAINVGLLVASVALSVWYVAQPANVWLYWAATAAACLLGVTLVIAIGGADMPVVISLLNAYTGGAAATQGFVIQNSVLIVTGALVGASGFILTALMCKAMNRSLANVILGGVGTVAASDIAKADVIYGGRVKAAQPDEVAMILADAKRVVIVPGYGLATAQAQFAVQDMAKLLEERGTVVEFGIHPVAGRMPGHMNVLLAEANVSYEKLKDMDQINPTFRQTDVVVVIGANDVVNPMAREADPSIPIAGMPILNVDQARTVVVIKRSLSPGFAGIPNPLFAADNTLMLFSDAKKACMDLVAAIKGS